LFDIPTELKKRRKSTYTTSNSHYK